MLGRGGMVGPGGGSGSPSDISRAVGLPFAGIPPEMRPGVQKIVESEPEHKEVEVDFSQGSWDKRPLTLKRLIAPYWLSLSLAFLLVILGIITQQIGPLLTKIAIDKGIMQQEMNILILVAVVYIGSVFLNALVGFARTSWTGRVGENLMLSLRVRVFSHLQRLSIDFFTKEKSGRIMTRMTSDIESLTQLLHEGIINLAVQALTMVFVTIVLFTMNAKLALVMVLFVTPVMTALTLWFRQASERGYGIVRDRIADVLADFQENLTGIRVINALNRQRHNIIHHLNVIGRYRDSNLYTARVGSLYGAGTDLISTIGQALILLIGGRMIFRDQLTIGELTAFVLYLTAFFAPIQQLIQLYNIYQQGQAAMTKLRDLLATEPSVPEIDDAQELPSLEGEILFDRVNFSYEPNQPVLHDVALKIMPGETFAFVGETGAGKSTMAKLIVRFYDPTQGQVLIDGNDLKGVTLNSLRRQFGYVPQEPFLFAGTIRDNIAFSKAEATDNEVHEACRAVGISDLIEQLPHGIDTPVHERGATLSSGERQLLALARAFLARPRVIVLDEATSNLDLASESKIENALNVLLEGRTAVIIAHRLSTAMKADRIAVFHEGRIVELGSHEELLGLKGRYADMYATWTRHSGPESSAR
jgi:ATP-binding cassette subfamily B protein